MCLVFCHTHCCLIHNLQQVLDPSSRPQQMYQVGPVPVATIKRMCSEGLREDGKREKTGRKVAMGSVERVNSNGAEIIASEVSADVRFLRVSKSYASITNRVLSVALVRHSEVGVRIVTSEGVSLTPVDITDTYKGAESLKEATPILPSRDCSVEVGMVGDGGGLGEKMELMVTITNHGHLLRTLDGRVEGHIIRYTHIILARQ